MSVMPRRGLLALLGLVLPSAAGAVMPGAMPPAPESTQPEAIRGGFRLGRGGGLRLGRRRSAPHFSRDYRFRQKPNRY